MFVSNFRQLRSYSGPPIKRYAGFHNWPALLWNTRVPAAAKACSGVLVGAASLIAVHPDTLITLGPPLAVGAYFLNRRLNHRQYVRLLAVVTPKSASEWLNNRCNVRIWSYDETDVENVVKGIETQSEHFQAQILQLVESRIVDYVVDKASTLDASALVSLLLDENSQVNVHLGEIETLVSTRAETVAPDGNTHFVDFFRLSVALFSKKNAHNRTRLGVADVSILALPTLEHEEQLQYQDYRIAIEITPFGHSGGTEVILEGTRELQSVEEFRRTEGDQGETKI